VVGLFLVGGLVIAAIIATLVWNRNRTADISIEKIVLPSLAIGLAVSSLLLPGLWLTVLWVRYGSDMTFCVLTSSSEVCKPLKTGVGTGDLIAASVVGACVSVVASWNILVHFAKLGAKSPPRKTSVQGPGERHTRTRRDGQDGPAGA